MYQGSFSVKLGPATAAYQGTLKMESLEAATRRSTMRASGRDRRGQGSANATIVSHVIPEGERTRVDVVTDFTIAGRLARFGRGGMIEDVANRLLQEFARGLQDLVVTEPPATSAGAAGSSGLGEDARAAPSPTASAEYAAGGPPSASAPPSAAAPLSAGAPPSGGAPPSATAPTSASPLRPRQINGIAMLFAVLRDRARRLLQTRRG